MHAALLGTIDWGALAGIAGSVATVAGVVGGLDFRRRRRAATSQRAVTGVLDADDDGEALALAQEHADDKAKIVLSLFDRELRHRVNCEVRLAEEKRERKADVKRLEATLEEMRRERS